MNMKLSYYKYCRFLQILQFIIQEPSPAFKRFVPSTMNLCMDHIYPLVCEVS